jgi:hypothetical protein
MTQWTIIMIIMEIKRKLSVKNIIKIKIKIINNVLQKKINNKLKKNLKIIYKIQ